MVRPRGWLRTILAADGVWTDGFSEIAATRTQLAERLARFRNRDDVVVLGLPRGGVPVAYEVARALTRRWMCS